MNSVDEELKHRRLTYEIIGAGMDVHNELGPGWDEIDYHFAMLKALELRGVNAVSHVKGTLIHQDKEIHRFELDILVENTVVVELKHIRGDFAPEHYAQLINYLKFWKSDLGLLMNFGLEKLRYKRIPFSPVKGTVEYEGRWNELSDSIFSATGLSNVCHAIVEKVGLGYGEGVCKKLLKEACSFANLTVSCPVVGLRYENVKLGDRRIDGFVLNDELAVKVTALREGTTASDLSRLLSCMKKLSIHCGVLVNFGRKVLTVRGLCPDSISHFY